MPVAVAAFPSSLFAQEPSNLRPKPAGTRVAPSSLNAKTETNEPAVMAPPKAGPVMLMRIGGHTAGHEGNRVDRLRGSRARTGSGGDHWAVEERLGPETGRHPVEDGRQSAAHERRRRHERQSRVRRRQADRRGGAPVERLLSGCDLRNHPDRADARDQRLRQLPSRGCARAETKRLRGADAQALFRATARAS